MEDWEICNASERRKNYLEAMVETLSEPYAEYSNEYNTKIKKAFIENLFEASLAGYEYANKWQEQTGEELDRSIERLFKLTRSFENITLTDDEFIKVANFANAMRNINGDDLISVGEQIEKNITENFFIYSTPGELLYVMSIEDNILQAILYYNLLPSTLSARTALICVPKEYLDEGYKVWLWGLGVEDSGEFWMPYIGAGLLYHREGTPSEQIENPLLLMPEWYYIIN